MYFPNKLTHDAPFTLSQEQRDVIQIVSTELGKKDVIIFGMIIRNFVDQIDSAILIFDLIF